MPLPMITVLQNGKGLAGKLNLIKEIILMPKPNISVQNVNFHGLIFLIWKIF